MHGEEAQAQPVGRCHCWARQRFLPAGRDGTGGGFPRSLLPAQVLPAGSAGVVVLVVLVMLCTTGLRLQGSAPCSHGVHGACAHPCTHPAPVPPTFWAGARGGDVGMGMGLGPRAVCAMGSRVAVRCSSLAGVGLPLHRSRTALGALVLRLGWSLGWGQLPAHQAGAGSSRHSAGTECGGCVALACAAPGGAGCLGGLRGCTLGGPQLRCLLSLPAAPGEGPDALPQAAERADRPQLPEASPGEGGTGHTRGGGALSRTPAAGLRRGPSPLQLARLAVGR